MNFSKALKHLKQGEKITRKLWIKDETKDDSWLELQVPIKGGPGQPYIGVTTANKQILMWYPEHVDILANDWVRN